MAKPLKLSTSQSKELPNEIWEIRNSSTSPQQAAAAELLARRVARNSLRWFTKYLDIGIEPALHHLLMIDKLEAVERGEIKRLIIQLPPGSAKSTYASQLFPSWYIGKHPDHDLIASSHTAELAEKFGRRVRNLCNTTEHVNLFPDARLADDSQAAHRWTTKVGGQYFAVGIGGAVTGHRGNGGIIDDPVKGREDADSETQRNKVKDWYINEFLTRLKPNAWIIIVMCMTGDTPIRMADGSEKMLKDIQPGDLIASYEDGRLTKSKVLKWKNQGVDNVFAISMESGITVRANERHPFLVKRHGQETWVRLKNLQVGDLMIRAFGANGLECDVVSKDADSSLRAKDFAYPTTTKTNGLSDIDHLPIAQSHVERHDCSIVMESPSLSTTQCTQHRKENALYADNSQERTYAPIGAENSALITATNLTKSEACYVTTATLLLDMPELKPFSYPPLDTYEITLDRIVSILPASSEDVFDIQVERTENFIANGLVSHNTRWNEDDLAGWLLDEAKHGGDQWEVLSLPAEAEADDPLGRKVGERLWPEWFTEEMLTRAKRDQRSWSALYQQRPAPDEGGYFQHHWFKWYREPPKHLIKLGTSDYAVTDGGGDGTEHGVFGIDSHEDIYVIDWWSGRTTSDEWIESQIDLMQAHKPSMWVGESGVIRRAIEAPLKKRMRQRRAFCRMEWLPSISDKPTRSRSFQALCASGKVYLPVDAPWLDQFMHQHLTFPAGKFDDMVDVTSILGRVIDKTRAAIIPAIKGHTRPKYGTFDWLIAGDKKQKSQYRMK